LIFLLFFVNWRTINANKTKQASKQHTTRNTRLWYVVWFTARALSTAGVSVSSCFVGATTSDKKQNKTRRYQTKQQQEKSHGFKRSQCVQYSSFVLPTRRMPQRHKRSQDHTEKRTKQNKTQSDAVLRPLARTHTLIRWRVAYDMKTNQWLNKKPYTPAHCVRKSEKTITWPPISPKVCTNRSILGRY